MENTTVKQLNNLWSKVDCSLSLNDCWNWNAGVSSNGYGQVRWNGRLIQAHRAAWMSVFGDIPNSLHVLHECDNRLCCNPYHLFLGTRLDNMRDMVSKGRLPPRYGEYSYNKKLTNELVAEIRRLYFQEKIIQEKISKIFNISQSQVSRIVRNKRWVSA